MSEEEIIKKYKDIINGVKESVNNKEDKLFFENNGWEIVDLEVIEILQGLLDLYNKEKEKNKKVIEMLQEHIKHCEQEAKGSLNNEICHIALKFDKHLLQELLEERN